MSCHHAPGIMGVVSHLHAATGDYENVGEKQKMIFHRPGFRLNKANGRRAAALGSLLLAAAGGVAPLQAQHDMAHGGLTIRSMAFGDIAYAASERQSPDGFLIGQLVGHVNVGMTDRLALFAEVSATARPAGYVIEAERLVIRYDFSDLFKLSAGRYHTPVGYWNTAFHHGAWLQTSVSRPEMIRYGSRLLPVHFVGILAEGVLPTSPLGLGYTAGVGNGRAENIARAGDAGDHDGSRAWVASLTSRPPALFGLEIGTSLYLDRIAMESGGATREQIGSGHLAWRRGRQEVIAEYARVFHRAPGGGGTANEGFYLQGSHRLSGIARDFQPYARLERVSTAATDAVFAGMGLDSEAAIAGLRYDFAPLAALKMEYRNERFAEPGRFNSLYLQASFAVPGILGGEQ